MPTNDPYHVSVFFSNPERRDAIVRSLEAIDASQVHAYQGRIDGVADAATIASLRDAGDVVIVASENTSRLATRPQTPTSPSAVPSNFAEQRRQYQSEISSLENSRKSNLKRQIGHLTDCATQFKQRATRSMVGGQLLGMMKLATAQVLPPDQSEQVYDILVKRPLKPTYREELQKHGNICLYRSPNIYRMFLTSATLAEVLQLTFVIGHEPYGIERTVTTALIDMLPNGGEADAIVEDVGKAIKAADATEEQDANGTELLGAVPEAQPATGQHAAEPIEFDLLVHRDFDSAKVATVIQAAGGKVVAQHADTIRFELPKLDLGFIGALAEIPEVRKLTPHQPPRLFADRARFLTGIDQINTNSTGNIADTYGGQGEVVAVFDSGIDQTHQDFKGRIKEAVSYQGCSAADAIGHGTHVCGILAGSGATSGGKIRGMAPGAQLVVFGIVDAHGRLKTPPDVGELLKLALEQNRDAKIINLSWGDKFDSEYDFGSLHVDRFIYEHEDILVVIAAGNNGRIDQGRYQFKSIGTPATAKNAISCGASGSDRPDIAVKWCDPPFQFPKPPGDFGMCTSERVGIISSRGPSDFDSIKPDVCACGIWVMAPLAGTRNDALFKTWQLPPDKQQPPSGYAYLGGTSMAAPVVSGAAAVLRQYLRVAENKPDPTAALLKSILIASARRLKAFTQAEGDPFTTIVGYPDFHQGFGRIDLSSVLPHPDAPPNRVLKFVDVRNGSNEALVAKSPEHSANASMRQFVFKVPPGAAHPLRLVLCWTDVPGKFLHNNLQLFLEGPSGQSWVGNTEFAFHRDPFAGDALDNAGVPVGVQLGGLDFDKYNNAELLSIDTPAAGAYRVSVIAQYTDPAEKAQGYALCVSGELVPGSFS